MMTVFSAMSPARLNEGDACYLVTEAHSHKAVGQEEELPVVLIHRGGEQR